MTQFNIELDTPMKRGHSGKGKGPKRLDTVSALDAIGEGTKRPLE